MAGPAGNAAIVPYGWPEANPALGTGPEQSRLRVVRHRHGRDR